MPNDISSGDMFANVVRAQCASKRKERRQRVLLRAHIHVVRIQSNFIVTDISRSGLRGTAGLNLVAGQPAFVSLDDLTYVEGTIRWVQDGRFGMTFSQLLDAVPGDGQIDLGYATDHQEHTPGAGTHLKAKLSLSSWSSTARIRNVSKNGMMVETELPVIQHNSYWCTGVMAKYLTPPFNGWRATAWAFNFRPLSRF